MNMIMNSVQITQWVIYLTCIGLEFVPMMVNDYAVAFSTIETMFSKYFIAIAGDIIFWCFGWLWKPWCWMRTSSFLLTGSIQYDNSCIALDMDQIMFWMKHTRWCQWKKLFFLSFIQINFWTWYKVADRFRIDEDS